MMFHCNPRQKRNLFLMLTGYIESEGPRAACGKIPVSTRASLRKEVCDADGNCSNPH